MKMPGERTKIIEIIGAPGVGKSTIYKALINSYNQYSDWIYPDADENRKKTGWIGIRSYSSLIYHKLFRKEQMSIFQVELGLKFVKEHKELADFIWRNISENETGVQEVGQRFRSAYFAFKHFCRYQKIMESYNDKPCIIEEGLLQKSFLIRDNEKEMLEAVHDYLYLVPLPKAIIYLNTSDAKVILDRLKSRKKTLPNHKDKNDKLLLENIERWQFLFDDIAKSLSKFNIPVYNVDGSKTVKENVQLINHILKNN